MKSPEEQRAHWDALQVQGQELKGQIVRAESWDQLFASPEEAQADFLARVVEDFRAEYLDNRSLRIHTVAPDPAGDVHRFDRTSAGGGGFTTVQRFTNGDVDIAFHHPGSLPSVSRIVPGTGNIAHDFTVADTAQPHHPAVLKLMRDKEAYAAAVQVIGTDLTFLSQYLRGKPAVMDWEETMLDNGHFPQRIGHRIYPSFVLEAQRKIRENLPHLMSR